MSCGVDINLLDVPEDVREKLAELDLELSEGDITQKGYEKKRGKLLAPYLTSQPEGRASPSSRSRRRAQRRVTRNESRYHSEVRQEAVQQALAAMQSRPKQLPMPSKRQSILAPNPGPATASSSATSSAATGHEHDHRRGANSRSQPSDADSSSDDDDDEDDSSVPGESATPDVSSDVSAASGSGLPTAATAAVAAVAAVTSAADTSTPTASAQLRDDFSPPLPHHHHHHYPRELPQQQQQQRPPPLPAHHPSQRHSVSSRDSQLLSNQQLPPQLPPTYHLRQQQQQQLPHQQQQRYSIDHSVISSPSVSSHVVAAADTITDITQLTNNDTINSFEPYSEPPDVTHNTGGGRGDSGGRGALARSQRHAPAKHMSSVRMNSSTNITAALDEAHGATAKWKVSSKIQQLLSTLKRPKRRPLPDFYVDDEQELEMSSRARDPTAPRPEGGIMTPVVGEHLEIPSGLPRNLESAVQRYGSATFKASCASVMDTSGKLSAPLTYGKLFSRAHKVAYALLTRARTVHDCGLKPGDRVALVYPNNDPTSFLTAFYGCLFAAMVPVPIEVPITRRDAGSDQVGFLLGGCGVQVALTTEACLKGLPRASSAGPGHSGDVAVFRGWPRLAWFVTEHLARPPRDWQPPPRLNDETPAYIEYTAASDGSVLGVNVTRAAMLAHCRTLTSACGYTEGEICVCVVDFKREVGLWHATLCSVFNGIHVVFIPYSLMKINPASWMHMVTKFKASIAIVRSRDLHWALLASGKEQRDISLSSLRLLLVADGANPWSLSSCDQFVSVFKSRGLRPDAVCPCAAGSETLTVAVRRPGSHVTGPTAAGGSSAGGGGGGGTCGRGVLSMAGLSHGVVRVDQENSLTALTLQDCGRVLPGASTVVVRCEGEPYLCCSDEVGEICVHSAATGSSYWGLAGVTNQTFSVHPLTSDGCRLSEQNYTRSGLLGFLGPGGLVFVCGSRAGLMTVSGRKHNSDDVIATVLAVEPMKFIYRGRVGVFSVRVLRDERICVVAEQRPECTEEQSFHWMSRVLQAVDSIHQVSLYCLCLVANNCLPKTPLGGIHLAETKRRFLAGSLHPVAVLMCPHACVTNLPRPRDPAKSDVGPASVMVGNIVQGNRLATAQGRDFSTCDSSSDLTLMSGSGSGGSGRGGEAEFGGSRKQQFISEVLRCRAQTTSDHVLFTLLTARGAPGQQLTCLQLHKRAERVGCQLLARGRVNTGDHVALVFPPGLDLIAAFYGCLYVGVVPVTVRPPHPQNLATTLPTVRMTVEMSKAVLLLTNQGVIKLLRSKEACGVVEAKQWPPFVDTDESHKRKLVAVYRAPTADMVAYLDFSVSTTGMLAGIKMSHAATTALCRSMKMACELYPSRHVALCLDPYCGLGFALWCLSSVFSGHHSILIPPSEVEANTSLWLSTISQHKVRDTFCSYGVMELCTRSHADSVPALRQRGVNLSCVRTCVVVAEERPRIGLCHSFSKLFSALGLSPRAVSTSFGCRVNVAICLQGAASPDPSTVYVDLRALRNDRVTVVERGAPHSLCLMESGKLLPGVRVIIANPETKGHCGDSNLGEIWVQSEHTSSGYFGIYGDANGTGDHFGAQLVTGATGEVYARTGYLGFLRRTDSLGADGEKHDAVFVVGSLDETLTLRGLRYHPIDIETTVLKAHKKIVECAVFVWTNLLVVVAELAGGEEHALDLVPLITSTVLDHHQLVVGVVVVVDPGVVPINSRGEKQRMHLRDGFLHDQLDPIYVAYNM